MISAIELRRGNRWDQDDWFKHFLNFVVIQTGSGESTNRDLNELELLLARAVINGLIYGRNADAPVSSTDGETAGPEDPEEPPGEPTPIAKAEAPREEEPPQGAASSGVQAERTQYFRMDIGPETSETVGGKGLGERAELRAERDVRQAGEQAETRPRPRVESYQSARSASREERMTALEEAVLRISQTLESRGFRSTELRGPPPKARPEYVEYPYERPPSHRRQSSPYQGASSKY